MFAKEIRKKAWESLKGKWGTFALITLIYLILDGLASSFIGIIFLLVAGAFELGISKTGLFVARGKEINIENLFEGFKSFDLFGKTFLLYLVNTIFIFLWSLLFIIPGIIKELSYSMSYYILNDNPNMSSSEARKESKRLMQGNKWRYFCLQFSFIGWILLTVLTCGILLFWVIPYIQTANAVFYEELKEKNDVIITTKENILKETATDDNSSDENK